jgi:hypothetical protein
MYIFSETSICYCFKCKRDIRGENEFYQLEHENQTSHLADDRIPSPTSRSARINLGHCLYIFPAMSDVTLKEDLHIAEKITNVPNLRNIKRIWKKKLNQHHRQNNSTYHSINSFD